MNRTRSRYSIQTPKIAVLTDIGLLIGVSYIAASDGFSWAGSAGKGDKHILRRMEGALVARQEQFGVCRRLELFVFSHKKLDSLRPANVDDFSIVCW